MEKQGVRRSPFLFDGTGSQNYQGHQVQALEDRGSNRRPAGLCSFDFDWQDQPVVHSLEIRQGSWLRQPGRGGHCMTVLEESDGR